MNLKSVIEVEIDRPLQDVAELFADPHNNTEWMQDVKRYEPVSGEQGLPGSTYRLVPKEGELMFLATVMKRNLPHELRVNFTAATVDMAMTARMAALSPTRTKLISEEEFTFKDSENEPVDSSVKEAIKANHRRHIEAFKHFAEER
jgi:hypothetical protein